MCCRGAKVAWQAAAAVAAQQQQAALVGLHPWSGLQQQWTPKRIGMSCTCTWAGTIPACCSIFTYRESGVPCVAAHLLKMTNR
jgi:hypothetical protein